MSILNDKTTQIERDIQKEYTPGLKHIVRMWRYVFSSAKVICFIFMGLTIVLSLLRPVLAFIWNNYIDKANSYVSGSDILPLVSFAVAYFAINFIADILTRYTESRETIERLDIVQKNRFQEMLDSRMYKKVSALGTEHTDTPKINDSFARVSGFTSAAWDGLSQSIMKPGYLITAKIVSVVSIATSLYIINPWLCLILVAAPVPTLYTTYVGNKLTFRFIKDNIKLSREIAYFQKLMTDSAIKEIKVLNLFDFFYAKWKTRADDYSIKERRIYLKRAGLGAVNNTLMSLTSVSATVLAIVLLTQGQISIGALAAVMSLINTLINDTSSLFTHTATFLSRKHEAAMFFDVMDLPEEKTDGAAIDEVYNISTDNLAYRYPLTDKYVLKDINVTIKSGEKVAFVGENGAGKTTFVKLIAGLIQPSLGELRINGTSSADVNPQSRYDRQSMVAQEPARFNTFTVADNVFIGDTAKVRNEGEIERAMCFAGLDDVEPDTLLGKDIGGSDLSGGQWQKIAIARSCYRGRNFIILDEPTGNLDPLVEVQIFQKYLELAQDKTVIMVTHRISVASLADRIIVFENGGITGDGTHDELMARCGEYARLYNAQAKWYDR